MDWKQLKDLVTARLAAVSPDTGCHPKWDRLKYILREGTRQFIRINLRWSYLAIAGMVVIGVVVNLTLAHGWTVWPVVLAAGIMLMVHEAAERNRQGVPPLHAYALFISAMAAWLATLVVLSAINPVVLLIGFIALGYYCTLGYVKDLERRKVMTQRRAEGLCVHCGHPADYELAMCLHCGREPDPDDAQLKRVGHTSRSSREKARARQNLTPKPPTASAAKKEQALLARRRTRRSRK